MALNLAPGDPPSAQRTEPYSQPSPPWPPAPVPSPAGPSPAGPNSSGPTVPGASEPGPSEAGSKEAGSNEAGLSAGGGGGDGAVADAPLAGAPPAGAPPAGEPLRQGARGDELGTGRPEAPAAWARRLQPAAWLRQVSFRGRISLLVGVAVAISVAMTALVSYVIVSRQIDAQVRPALEQAIQEVPRSLHLAPDVNGGFTIPPEDLANFEFQTGDLVQVLVGTKQVITATGQRIFPLSPGARQALQQSENNSSPTFETLTGKDGRQYRVADLATNVPNLAVQVGYPLTGIHRTLAYLRLVLTLLALCGVALALTLGWAVGRRSLGPVEDLTLAAEHVAATQDLNASIQDEGNDELARLARSFNAMLAALRDSKSQQAQLVSDAGHELRTPLTSLRTNIEVLMRARDLSGPDRQELLGDIDAQLQELTNLVGDLVDLAREDERTPAEPETVEFQELVTRAVERAQRRGMSLSFDVDLEPGLVRAQPALLERAIMNVLDNAAKWSPTGGHVEVTLRKGKAWRLSVADQGPGIAPEDLPRIFDRFYRAKTARAMPGSGLGLAIVKRVITSHGGTIEVASTPGAGGTRVDITLPQEDALGDQAPPLPSLEG